LASVLLVGKAAPARGGIPSFLDMLATSDLAQRHRLELLNLADDDATPEGGRATWGNVRRTGRDVRRVWRAARARDVVHVHTAGAPAVTMARLGLLVLAARLRGARVVAHVHGGLVVAMLTGRVGRVVARAALLPAHRVVAVASTVHDALQRVVAPRRLELLRNGVDTARFSPDPTPRDGRVPRLLFVGLLTPRKGVLDLFEASRALRSRGVEHELWLAGGTPDEGPEAERQVREAAPSWTRWLGRCPPDRMPGVYADADVFCLPSWWEGTPLTVLEAMASGLPVVASRVGDVPHLLDDATGRLVPARDPDALARALEPLLVDAEVRARMGAAARERTTTRFGVGATVERLDEIYRGAA
jgi:glycosyltransferase involved in cell wall biosynthesis